MPGTLTRHYLSWRILSAMAVFTVTFVAIAVIGFQALSEFQTRARFVKLFAHLFEATSRLENELAWSSLPAATATRGAKADTRFREALGLYLALRGTDHAEHVMQETRWSVLQTEYGIDTEAERTRFGLREGDMPSEAHALWHSDHQPEAALVDIVGEFLTLANKVIDAPDGQLGPETQRDLETLRTLSEARLMPAFQAAIHMLGGGMTARASFALLLLIACAGAGLLATLLSHALVFRPLRRRILDAQAALVEERDQARSSERANREFLAMMSHELRTPMNAVIGFTDLLLTTSLGSKQRDYAETIKEAAHALLSLLNSILELSKIEAGPLALEETDFAPETLVSEVMTLLTPQALSKRLDLSAYVDPTLPPLMRGDEGRLRQILANLAGNAIKFTASGGVAIEVRRENGDSRMHEILIAVTDTGIGLAKEQQRRIFERFTQVDSSATRKFEGSGLGLSITRELVSRMGGEIGVDSTPDKGSTFWVRLKLAEAETPAAPLPGRARVKFAGRRIVVVDDNALNRRIFRLQLEAHGAEVDTVGNGRAAIVTLTQAAHRGKLHDLAIIDQMMPEIDGLALRKLIREHPEFASLKLIISSSAGIALDQQARALGFDAACPKPILQEKLIAKIDELLTPRETEDAAAPVAVLPTKQAAAPPPRKEPRSGPPRLLVVEDNPINQRLIMTALRQARFHVEMVGDGLEAVNAVQREEYDVVLMDIRMPVMNGIEATQRIRALPGPCAKTPIIAMTANAMVGDREEYLAAGMDDYVAKPIDFNILMTKIRAHLPLGMTESGGETTPWAEKKRG